MIIIPYLFLQFILLGIREKEHCSLLLEDFVKREDGGFTVYIYRSETNQRGVFGNRGKADKVLIPYNEAIISYYDKYISLRPKNADPEFYLQEMGDEGVAFSFKYKQKANLSIHNYKNSSFNWCMV